MPDPTIPPAELEHVFSSTETPEAVEALVKPVVGSTAGVWRVKTASRMAILKLLQPGPANTAEDTSWASEEDPSAPYYWRREADLYTSGALQSPVPGIRAPRWLGTFDRDDGTTALWLEDVQGRPGSTMTRPEMCALAEAFGRWQAAMDGEILGSPVLSRDWLRAYVKRHDTDIALLSDPALDASSISPVLTPGVVAEARRIWDELDHLFRTLDASPAGICHFDLTPKNTIWTHDEFVLIDWAYAGSGALGSDIGPFAVNASADFAIDPEDVLAVGDSMVTAYADGLAAGGCPVDYVAVRRAAAAATAVKFAWLLPAVLLGARSNWKTFNGVERSVGITWWARLIPAVVRSAEIARQLSS